MKLSEILPTIRRSSKSQKIATLAKIKATRMNPIAAKSTSINRSGINPNDAEANMGSTSDGSRYQTTTS